MEAAAKIDPGKEYGLKEAITLFHEVATAKFNESMEVHVRLGVDPRHADQQVRSTVSLPHGTGVTKRVLALASGEKNQRSRRCRCRCCGRRRPGAENSRRMAGV